MGGCEREPIIPPMVGSLFSWKSLLTKRRTNEDCCSHRECQLSLVSLIQGRFPGTDPGLDLVLTISAWMHALRTLPTAASPSKTSLTLLLGLGAAFAESAMVEYM